MKKRTYTLGIKTQATSGHYFISLKQDGKELLKLTGFKTINAATEAGHQWQEWRGTLNTFKRFVNVQHTKTPLFTAAKEALEKNLATYNAARNKTAPDYSVQAQLYAEAEALRDEAARLRDEVAAAKLDANDFEDAHVAVCRPDVVQLKPATGKKFDDGKARWDLLPWQATTEVVDVLTFGARKYGAHNWQLVESHDERYTAAALRHISAWRKGEALDQESNLHHLAHATCCLLFLLDQIKTNSKAEAA